MSMRIIGLAFCLVCLFVAGLIWTYQGISDARKAARASSWPTVQGTVRSSEVAEVWHRKGRSYRADIKYDYRVGPTSYVGERVRVEGFSLGLKGGAEKVVSRYPAGQAVTVHYESENPDSALLEVGLTLGHLFRIGLGLLMVGIGIGVPWYVVTRR
jgi:hypothetical protein